MMLHILFVQIYIIGLAVGNLSPGTRVVINKRSVKSRAFNRACVVHDCRNTECNTEEGWNIYGSDLGCCGNYGGCCRVASVVCYLHDVMCKCCDYGWLICGPDCQREPECDNKVEADYQHGHRNSHSHNEFQNSLSQKETNNFSQQTNQADEDNNLSFKQIETNYTKTAMSTNNTNITTLLAKEDNEEIDKVKDLNCTDGENTTEELPLNVEYQKEGLMEDGESYKQKIKSDLNNHVNSVENENYYRKLFMSDQPNNDMTDDNGSGEIV